MPKKVLEKLAAGPYSQGVKNALNEMITREPDFNLADFQVRGTERILSCLEKKVYSGTLISAGTGSGKTLAFYIPALARIASKIIEENENSTTTFNDEYPIEDEFCSNSK